MALPPDPIEDVLPLASAVVLAQVSSIVSQSPQEPIPASDPRRKGGQQQPLADQLVTLRIETVLRGDSISTGAELQAHKPSGDYSLAEGVSGPFLLAEKNDNEAAYTILGRYGPDSYRQHVIEAALAKSKK